MFTIYDLISIFIYIYTWLPSVHADLEDPDVLFVVLYFKLSTDTLCILFNALFKFVSHRKSDIKFDLSYVQKISVSDS